MTADINVILQLLQRQITPVPPAYNSVSPGSHCADPSILYGTSGPVLYNLYPIQLGESRTTMIQSMTRPDSEFTPKPLDSQLSSLHMMATEKNEESTRHMSAKTLPSVTPILQAAPSVRDTTRLHASLRFSSLPGNLDSSLPLAEIQKHVSDPVLAINQRLQKKLLPNSTTLHQQI
ncbi:hypothetical protein PDJAM_G00032390 [Pangasius djambal]|uniref:Uncharacterized protein n=1 Tax=Pangasius djambal TaxID=1691987 RepID=A0ACC5YRR8_9TELE|nr:hypothetical protein [Pangasius djambal]